MGGGREVWREAPAAGLYGRVGQEKVVCVVLGRRWRWLEALEERGCEGVVEREVFFC